jgi:OOP family OmpA-OmpF porin
MKKHFGLLGALGCCLALSLPFTAHAQFVPAAAAEAESSSDEGSGGDDSGDRRFYVSPMFSYTMVDDDRDTDDAMGGVISLGKSFTSGLNLELTGFVQEMDPEQDTNTANTNDEKSVRMTGVGAAAMIFPSQTLPYAYLLVGLHAGQATDHTTRPSGTPAVRGAPMDYRTTVFDTGLGYIFPLSPYLGGFEMALRGEARYRMDAHTREQAGAGGQKHFYEPVFNLGVMIPLGKLPAEAAPVQEVEVVAAEEPAPPADTDGDGVPDDADTCPETPAGTAVNEQGCPATTDADGDGVQDDKDTCPETPAGTAVDESGCPPKVEGCRAPMPGEPINLEGCATGESVVLKGVNFEVNSARLTANAKAILNQVADSLAATPGMKVEIGGHTDAQGSDAFNLKLSERRAQSVHDYLVARGIDPGRLSSKGYGESQPVDTNETPEGRELNRRVEMKVLEGG